MQFLAAHLGFLDGFDIDCGVDVPDVVGVDIVEETGSVEAGVLVVEESLDDMFVMVIGIRTEDDLTVIL